MRIDTNHREPTFEEACRKAEFSELIRLSLALTDAALSLWAWLKAHFGQPTTGNPSQA